MNKLTQGPKELKKIEKREWQLWSLIIILFLAFVFFLTLAYFYWMLPVVGLDEYTVNVLLVGFVGISLLFCAYIVFTEKSIKGLRRGMMEAERIRVVELMKAYEELDSIVKNIGDSVIVTDLEGRIKEVNEATCSILGYGRGELINKSAAMLFREGEILFKESRWRYLIVEGYMRSRRLTYVTKYGDEIPIIFSGSMRLDESRTPIGVIGVAHDAREIEKVKKREEDLEAVMKKLKMAPVYSLKKGQSYIIKEKDKGYDMFKEQFLHGVQSGLCLTKLAPLKVKERYRIPKSSVVFWVSFEKDINAISPRDIRGIELKISDFVKETESSAVLLDCFDEIKTVNGWDKAISWLQEVKDICREDNAILLLSVDPDMFKEEQLALIERDAEVVS